jgi:hypothetical protein
MVEKRSKDCQIKNNPQSKNQVDEKLFTNKTYFFRIYPRNINNKPKVRTQAAKEKIIFIPKKAVYNKYNNN